MTKPAVIGFYGYSNSGKTELISKIISELTKQDVEIATVKHTDKKIDLDDEGTDTWTHAQWGARLTVLHTPNGSSIITRYEQDLDEILNGALAEGDWDVIFLEGYKNYSGPKIAVGEIDPVPGTIHHHRSDFGETKNVVDEEIEIQNIQHKLGGLDCGKCSKGNCRDLARSIFQGQNSIDDCPVIESKTVSLSVDGERVHLSRFPAQLIEGTVTGMVETLKGVDKTTQIKIEILRSD